MKGQRENEFLIRSVVFTETGHSKLMHWDNQRDGMGREVGRGFGMGSTCTPMTDSCQCIAETTTIL